MTTFNKLRLLLICILPIACFAHDNPTSHVKKAVRHELITRSSQQCKVPCWTQTCQTAYPRCPFTTCNRDYDATMTKLFYPEGPWDSSRDHKKKYCVDAIRNGYGCFNMYKFVCPVMNMTVGKNIKLLCTEQLICTDALHTSIQPCAPALSFYMLQFCCSMVIKKCDYCVLDTLSKRGTYGPMLPEIEDI